MKKQTALLSGPTAFLVVYFAAQSFGAAAAGALGMAAWMALWWALRPVAIAVTALLPIAVNAALTLIPNGETARRKSFLLFGLRLPYHISAVRSPYSVSSRELWSPCPLNITLPLGTSVETVSALEYQEQELDDNSAEELYKAVKQ